MSTNLSDLWGKGTCLELTARLCFKCLQFRAEVLRFGIIILTMMLAGRILSGQKPSKYFWVIFSHNFQCHVKIDFRCQKKKDVVLRSEKLSSQDIFIFRHLFGMMFVRCFRSLQVFETAQQVVKWLLFKSELENHPNISWLFQGYTHFFCHRFSQRQKLFFN